ncbi:hypothetical protein LSAT2_002176 [Lamellibrachia satsuma]|nr:hypothetical protein LSAT2_002176 [Lamellibrachia satsuma]
MSTKEITETRNGKTSVHRVGPLAGLSAVVFWGATAAFIITVVAVAIPYWVKLGSFHQGLWKYCQGSVCFKLSGLPGWFKAIQAFVCMSMVLSIGAFLLSFVYTFVHSVSKGVVLQLIIVAAALAALFMLVAAIWFVAKQEKHFGSSFFLGGFALVLDVVVAVAGGLQKKKADAAA